MMEPLQALSEFAAQLNFADLAAEVQDQTRYVLLDTVGAIAAGSAEPEMGALTKRLASHAAPSTVIGTGDKASSDRAAFFNGTAGTLMEIDEGNRFSRGHPGIHVIPAVHAHAEAKGSSGAEAMSAIIAGYEVGSRVGYATNLRGSMHPHGTWGTVGAAAAIKRWGVPVQRVLTDNGMAFRSGLFAEACLELGITQKFTRAYRPQTNGKAERFIQSALREWAYGRIYENSDQRRQALPAWTHFYNWHRPHHGINLMPPVSRLSVPRKNLLTLHS